MTTKTGPPDQDPDSAAQLPTDVPRLRPEIEALIAKAKTLPRPPDPPPLSEDRKQFLLEWRAVALELGYDPYELGELEHSTKVPQGTGDVDPVLYRDLVITAFSLPVGTRALLLDHRKLHDIIAGSISPKALAQRIEHLRGLRDDLLAIHDEVRAVLPHAWGLSSDDARLTATQHAAVLRRAMPGLLHLLPGGAASHLATGLFTRIAESVEGGGPAELRGTLAEVFQPEIRVLERRRTGEGKRSNLLASAVHPTLTVLRGLRPIRVVVQYRVYLVQLEMDSPGGSAGRVRGEYTFRLRVIPVLDSDATTGMLTDVVLHPVRRALEADAVLCKAILRRLGTVGARIAADAAVAAAKGQASIGPSPTRRALRAIDAMSTVLTPAERWQFLSHLFSLQGDPRLRTVQFEDAYLWAASARLPREVEVIFNTMVLKTRLQLLPIPFVEKVALLAWFCAPMTPWPLRYRLWNAVSFLRRAIAIDPPSAPSFTAPTPPIEAERIVAERTGDLEGLLRLAEEQDLGQLLGGRWVPWSE